MRHATTCVCPSALFSKHPHSSARLGLLQVYEEFLRRATAVVGQLRQGPAVGGAGGAVDLGAMCMPGLAEKVQALVDDAVARGAKVGQRGLAPRIPAERLLDARPWGGASSCLLRDS
jgi:hypothetical protein